MSNILVTAIGSFSADIVIKKLKEANNYVVGCDIYPKEWIVDAMNVDRFYQAPYATSADDYIEFILWACEENKVHYVLPLTDVEVDVLNGNRGKLEEKGVILCISDARCIERCRDKYVLFEYLSNCKVEGMIPTKKASEISIKELAFPVVLKPVDGRSSQGLFFLNSSKQAEHVLEEVDVSKYIVQPKIEGDIITVDVVRDIKSKKSIAICRKELLRTLNGAGLSVHVFRDEALEKEAINLADCLGIQGCVNFEFIETKEKKRYFLECNPRFSGGVEFSCLAGYDCIGNHIRCFSGELMEDVSDIREMYIARKYKEYITKVFD